MKILTHDEMMQLKESNYEEFLSYVKTQMESNDAPYLDKKDWQLRVFELNRGKKRDEAAKLKMSQSAKNKAPISEDTRKKLSKASKERKKESLSDESKQKISNSLKGKIPTDESVEKIRKKSSSREKKSGLPVGVFYSNSRKKYRACISIKKTPCYLGYFETSKEASEQYQRALDSLKNKDGWIDTFINKDKKNKNTHKWIYFKENNKSNSYLVRVNKKHLGYFSTIEQAVEVRDNYLKQNSERS